MENGKTGTRVMENGKTGTRVMKNGIGHYFFSLVEWTSGDKSTQVENGMYRIPGEKRSLLI